MSPRSCVHVPTMFLTIPAIFDMLRGAFNPSAMAWTICPTVFMAPLKTLTSFRVSSYMPPAVLYRFVKLARALFTMSITASHSAVAGFSMATCTTARIIRLASLRMVGESKSSAASAAAARAVAAASRAAAAAAPTAPATAAPAAAAPAAAAPAASTNVAFRAPKRSIATSLAAASSAFTSLKKEEMRFVISRRIDAFVGSIRISVSRTLSGRPITIALIFPMFLIASLN